MKHSALSFCIVILIACMAPALAQAPPRLTALPQQATSPILSFQKGKFGGAVKEVNIGGWLVLNGANLRNSEFPDLAKILAERNAQRGFVSKDPEVTQLPTELYESKPDGRIARGYAICPLSSLCGDLIGTVMPFNLETSQ